MNTPKGCLHFDDEVDDQPDVDQSDDGLDDVVVDKTWLAARKVTVQKLMAIIGLPVIRRFNPSLSKVKVK